MRVGRRRVDITKPDKPLFDGGVTKRDLVEYYVVVANVMLPHVRHRPMTLERYPDGIDGEQVFTKQIPKYFPDWFGRATLPKEGGEVTYAVCNEKAALAYLANQACITMHVGLSRVPSPDRPDHMVFDLDPPEGDLSSLRSAAAAVRGLLEATGLAPVVKTSGSKGLHITVPLDGKIAFDGVRAFARDVATEVARRDPEHVTTEQRKKNRAGRLYLDWMRNGYGATVVAPWSVRARPGAPVAVPLAWDEIDDESFRPGMFSLEDAARRAEGPDPWRGWRERTRSLRAARRRLDRLSEG